MDLIFSDSLLPTKVVKSLFLAGPTPREVNSLEWRHQAIKDLENLGFDGTVFIPVPKAIYEGSTDATEWHFDNQIAWERKARAIADIIVFWIPRNIQGGMPAFTTNFELGEDLASGKVVYGRPIDAEKCRYMDYQMEHYKNPLPIHETLMDTLRTAVTKLGNGAFREAGEVNIPLNVWHTSQFQSWYKSLCANGNRLSDARVLSVVPYKQDGIYAYTLWVSVWIDSEQRYKANEFVFSRPDISAVLAYSKNADNIYKTKVVLVREFRSPVNNEDGFVFELPGGSPDKGELSKEGYVFNPLKNASVEFKEEAGLKIEDVSRFEYVGERQLMATVSTHKASVYKVELTADEMAFIEKNALEQTRFGVGGEMTYLVVTELKDLRSLSLDYSALGMIYEALAL